MLLEYSYNLIAAILIHVSPYRKKQDPQIQSIFMESLKFKRMSVKVSLYYVTFEDQNR